MIIQRPLILISLLMYSSLSLAQSDVELVARILERMQNNEEKKSAAEAVSDTLIAQERPTDEMKRFADAIPNDNRRAMRTAMAKLNYFAGNLSDKVAVMKFLGLEATENDDWQGIIDYAAKDIREMKPTAVTTGSRVLITLKNCAVEKRDSKVLQFLKPIWDMNTTELRDQSGIDHRVFEDFTYNFHSAGRQICRDGFLQYLKIAAVLGTFDEALDRLIIPETDGYGAGSYQIRVNMLLDSAAVVALETTGKHEKAIRLVQRLIGRLKKQSFSALLNSDTAYACDSVLLQWLTEAYLAVKEVEEAQLIFNTYLDFCWDDERLKKGPSEVVDARIECLLLAGKTIGEAWLANEQPEPAGQIFRNMFRVVQKRHNVKLDHYLSGDAGFRGLDTYGKSDFEWDPSTWSLFEFGSEVVAAGSMDERQIETLVHLICVSPIDEPTREQILHDLDLKLLGKFGEKMCGFSRGFRSQVTDELLDLDLMLAELSHDSDRQQRNERLQELPKYYGRSSPDDNIQKSPFAKDLTPVVIDNAQAKIAAKWVEFGDAGRAREIIDTLTGQAKDYALTRAVQQSLRADQWKEALDWLGAIRTLPETEATKSAACPDIPTDLSKDFPWKDFALADVAIALCTSKSEERCTLVSKWLDDHP